LSIIIGTVIDFSDFVCDYFANYLIILSSELVGCLALDALVLTSVIFNTEFNRRYRVTHIVGGIKEILGVTLHTSSVIFVHFTAQNRLLLVMHTLEGRVDVKSILTLAAFFWVLILKAIVNGSFATWFGFEIICVVSEMEIIPHIRVKVEGVTVEDVKIKRCGFASIFQIFGITFITFQIS
jgi:hypothetical protein